MEQYSLECKKCNSAFIVKGKWNKNNRLYCSRDCSIYTFDLKFREHVGKTFNRLQLLDKSYVSVNAAYKAYFKCVCGKEKLINFNSVLSGQTKSCGCQNKEAQLINGQKLTKRNQRLGSPAKKSHGHASFNDLYNQYKSGSKHRRDGNLEFNLSKEEFKVLTSSNCYYCNNPPNLIRKTSKNFNGDYLHNGIDRKNSEIGYNKDNSLPCCSFCNYMKLDYSYNEFVNQIEKIYLNIYGKK